MWLSCSPLSKLLLFSCMGLDVNSFKDLSGLSQSTWCCVSHAWTTIQLFVSPRLTNSLIVNLFSSVCPWPVSLMYHLSKCLQGISYTTPCWMGSSLGMRVLVNFDIEMYRIQKCLKNCAGRVCDEQHHADEINPLQNLHLEIKDPYMLNSSSTHSCNKFSLTHT